MKTTDSESRISFAGIDLGGTSIKGGIFSAAGTLLGQKSVPTPVDGGFDMIVQAIEALLAELADRYGGELSQLETVGVGVPGICNKEGSVYSAHNLGWKEPVNLKAALETALGSAVVVENDATVAAYAEWKKGALQGVDNGVLVTVGTGIGGGFVLNGDIYRGKQGLGGELGHLIIQADGEDCNCGSKGCFEVYGSVTALIKHVHKLIQEGRQTQLRQLLAAKGNQLAGKIIFEEAEKGDPVAYEAVQQMIHYLSIGIANLITLLEPERIALGGGASGAGDFLMEPLKRKVEQSTFLKGKAYPTLILPAIMGNDAGIIGAGLLGKEKKS